MRSIAGQCAGRGVEGGKRATDAGIIFQGVETRIDRDGQPTGVLEVIAELYAFVIERTDIAESSILVDAVHAQTHAATFGADEPAVRKIVAHMGKAAASGAAAVKARKIAVSVRARADGQIVTEADGPAWDPICYWGGLGVSGSRAQTECRQCQRNN